MLLTATSVLLVISTLWLVWAKSIISSVRILTLQSLLLGIAAWSLAIRTGESALFVMAVLTVLVKALAIPAILAHTVRKIDIKLDATQYIGRELALLLAGGLTVFSFIVTKRLDAFTPDVGQHYLPDAIAMVLVGLLVMVAHKKAIMQGIGLVVIENGLFLLALSLAAGMPFVVEVGIFLDVLVSVILISMLSYRMNQTFSSISTDWLRKLKG